VLVVLPVIGVEFPEDATRAEIAVLLDACDQAFLEGHCGEIERDAGVEFELTATITWLSETEARVGLERPADKAADSEEVSFVAQDEPLERYRSLGFAIGTLGSEFVTEPEPEPLPEPAPPLQVPEPVARNPDDPPDPIPDAALETPPEPLPVELTRFQLETGIAGGNGLGNPRFGAEFGIWAPVHRRWVTHWSFGYAVQRPTDAGVGAAFTVGNASVGPRFLIRTVQLAAMVGVQAQLVEASLGEAELARDRPAVGPLMGLQARMGGRLAPYLGMRVSYLSETPVTETSVDASGEVIEDSTREHARHGPWQLEGCIGLSFAFEP
jgi:hypothetical protein